MADEYQGGIDVLVILLDIAGIALGRLPLVHHVEVDTRVTGLLLWVTRKVVLNDAVLGRIVPGRYKNQRTWSVDVMVYHWCVDRVGMQPVAEQGD